MMKWNKVVGYEGLYEVSDTGLVRSLDREYIDSIGRHTIRHGHILKPSVNAHGYKRVTLFLFYFHFKDLSKIPNETCTKATSHRERHSTQDS